MKPLNIVIIVIVLLIGGVVPAVSQETPDWGTKFEIVISFDYVSLGNPSKLSKNDRKLYDQYDRIDGDMIFPSWSPDGKWIAICAIFGTGIWIVPSEGGEPTLIYENYQFETETQYYLNSFMNICFTPDSKEITFVEFFYDEEKGSIIEIEENFINARNSISIIKSVNIETGESRYIADGTYPCWSHNGRYLVYKNYDYRIRFDDLPTDHHDALTIYDTETGETWFLSDEDLEYNFGLPTFSLDDSHIIVSMNTKKSEYKFNNNEYYEHQLFRIPLEGGEPEQITFYNGGSTGEIRWYPDISPDGEWLLYTDLNRQETVVVNNYPKNIRKLCVYNMITGETFNVLPASKTIDTWNGTWSGDGTRFCYMFEGYENYDDKYSIYIKDFNPDNLISSVFDDTAKPSGFALLRNYPNPFNSNTTIEFTLSNGGFANLIIYNMMGQKICELVSSNMAPGIHSVVWDGRDERGLPVNSGIYVSHLKMGKKIFSNRMILIK